MKDFDYYRTNTVPYPEREDFSTTYWYHRGSVVAKQDPSMDEPKFYNDPELLPLCVKEVVLDTKALHEAQNAYRQEHARLQAEFKADLFEEFGVTNHPKASLAWDLAYDRGHGNGYKDIYLEFQDLVELIS